MSATLNPTLLYVAGGLIYAVAWALLMARKGVALSGPRLRGGATALAVEFGRALLVAIPATIAIGLFAWYLSSPYFNPPRGAIR